MILPLRKLHRLAFLCMAVVVPVVMFMAVAGRSPQPGASRLPVDTADNPSTIVLESADLWRSVAIVTRLLRTEGAGGERYDIELSGDEIGPRPDLLLYPGFPFWPWHGHRIHPRCAEYHVFSR